MTRPRHTIILCDWLPPAFGAVGQYEFQRAYEAARTGERVTLIGFGSRASIEKYAIAAGPSGPERAEAAPRATQASADAPSPSAVSGSRASAPDVFARESTGPDISGTAASTPGVSGPDASAPDTFVREGSRPSAPLPGTTGPGTSLPAASLPDAPSLGGEVPAGRDGARAASAAVLTADRSGTSETLAPEPPAPQTLAPKTEASPGAPDAPDAAQSPASPAPTGHLAIQRLAAKPAAKHSIVKRALWAAGMNWRLLRAGLKAAKAHPDARVKITGSPPFFSYVFLAWTKLFGPKRRIVYRITDFYPETAFVAGKGRFLKPLEGAFHALRRSADQVDALSNCQIRRLTESGVPRERIVLERDGSPVNLSGTIRPAPRPFSAQEIVLLYSGNLGVAHEWETFAQGYRLHCHEGANRVRVWLNATGVGAGAFADYCAEHGLPLHRSGPAPLEDLPGILMAADAHLILLRRDFWGYVFPSKSYACLETRRPIVYVGPEESDVHALLEANSPKHASVRNADVAGVAAALDALSQSAGS